MGFEHTWRWFGPNDPVTLQEIKQTGATAIVTALHQIPTGEVWPVDKILERKQMIEAVGLTWSVVESVPIHEDIKKRTGPFQKRLDHFKQTLRNLGQCGIDTVCYNFMPVLDWSRTNLNIPFKDGSRTSRFEAIIFAAFDLFILKRPNAPASYSEEQIGRAQKYFNGLDQTQTEQLIATILLGFPGSGDAYTLEELAAAIDAYQNIGHDQLHENLSRFLVEIVPVAEEAGIVLAIHPDDPPWPLLGLPRVVSSADDLKQILAAVDSPANGLTLCTGSLGAGIKNDLPGMALTFSDRIQFVHLRNVTRNTEGDFIEDNHLEGEIDLYDVMKTLLLEQQRRVKAGRRDTRLPMRPDHGHLMFDNLEKKNAYPGYSLIGRLKALAELRGMELGIIRSLGL